MSKLKLFRSAVGEYANSIDCEDVSDLEEIVVHGIDVSPHDLLTVLEGLPRLVSLTLTAAKIVELPHLPAQLVHLDLSNNLLPNLYFLLNLPALRYLYIERNPVRALEDLEPVSSLHFIKSIDMRQCPVASVQGFIPYIRTLVPLLRCLNGYQLFDSRGEDSELSYGGNKSPTSS